MAVVELKAAARTRTSRADMPHDRLGQIEALVPKQLHAKIQVDIFHIGKEIFVKPSHSFKSFPGIDPCRRASAEHLFGFGCGLTKRLGVVLAPGQAAGMVDVPFPVQGLGVAGVYEAGGKEMLRVLDTGLVDFFKPIRLRKGICI